MPVSGKGDWLYIGGSGRVAAEVADCGLSEDSTTAG